MHAPLRAAWLLFLLLALGAATPALAGPPTEADRQVDAFLDETASLFGGSEADIVKILGEPKDRQALPFQSPHDDAPYEVISMRHFDVQLIGGITLHQGKIAEMKTGEGKTLVATLPIVLNALDGKGAHLITVNDYLAKRDAAWMGKLYTYLGLTVGVIVHGLEDEERQANYAADITYGTNNEFGFDYLRDNMRPSERAQDGP